MSEQMREKFEAWAISRRFAVDRDKYLQGAPYTSVWTAGAWDAWQAAFATQPQAPQGAVTDAERYEFLCNCKDEIVMDFLAECIGSREAMNELVDSLIAEQRTAPETPEGQKP